MAYAVVLYASLYIIATVFTKPLQDPQPAHLSLPSEATSSGEIAQWSSQNLSANHDIEVVCNASNPFSDAVVLDCRSAKNRIDFGNRVYSWVNRPTQLVANFVGLPYRVMGDQGRCYFEPKLMSSANLAKASLNDVGIGMTTLFSKCALGRSSGGVAKFIGANRDLQVVLGSYTPTVQCRGSLANPQSCPQILTGISATTDMLVFGPPPADFIVPHGFYTQDRTCMARLFTRGSQDRASWYQIWEALTAIWAVCAKAGQGGLIQNLGYEKGLFVTLTADTGVVPIDQPLLGSNDTILHGQI